MSDVASSNSCFDHHCEICSRQIRVGNIQAILHSMTFLDVLGLSAILLSMCYEQGYNLKQSEAVLICGLNSLSHLDLWSQQSEAS